MNDPELREVNTYRLRISFPIRLEDPERRSDLLIRAVLQHVAFLDARGPFVIREFGPRQAIVGERAIGRSIDRILACHGFLHYLVPHRHVSRWTLYVTPLEFKRSAPRRIPP